MVGINKKEFLTKNKYTCLEKETSKIEKTLVMQKKYILFKSTIENSALIAFKISRVEGINSLLGFGWLTIVACFNNTETTTAFIDKAPAFIKKYINLSPNKSHQLPETSDYEAYTRVIEFSSADSAILQNLLQDTLLYLDSIEPFDLNTLQEIYNHFKLSKINRKFLADRLNTAFTKGALAGLFLLLGHPKEVGAYAGEFLSPKTGRNIALASKTTLSNATEFMKQH